MSTDAIMMKLDQIEKQLGAIWLAVKDCRCKQQVKDAPISGVLLHSVGWIKDMKETMDV